MKHPPLLSVPGQISYFREFERSRPNIRTGATVCSPRSMDGMGSMMGGMMVFGWIGGLLLLGLVIAGVVLLAKSPGGSGSNVVLTVLAVIGGVALVGVAAMALMHVGGIGCCG